MLRQLGRRRSQVWVVAVAAVGFAGCQNATLFGLQKKGSAQSVGNSNQFASQSGQTSEPATLDPSVRGRDHVVDPRTDTRVNPSGPTSLPGTPAPTQAVPAVRGNWAQFATNGSTQCGVMNHLDGKQSIYCWGDNNTGQLGIGTTSGPIETPQLVVGMSHIVVQSIAVGGGSGADFGHACAVIQIPQADVRLMESELHCWGANYSGQLGLQIYDQIRKSPERTFASRHHLQQVVAGQKHTCLMYSDGTTAVAAVTCAGSNDSGQLGVDVPLDPLHNLGGERSAYFLNVQGLPAYTTLVQLRAGQRHNCGLFRKQFGSAPAAYSVYCWGDNSLGQVGSFYEFGSAPPVVWRGFEAFRTEAPLAITEPSSGAGNGISLGDHHSCASTRKDSGETAVSCWGDNSHGQIMTQTPASEVVRAPVSLGLIAGTDQVRGLFASGVSTCVELSSGVACRGEVARGSPELADHDGFARISVPAAGSPVAGLQAMIFPSTEASLWMVQSQALYSGSRPSTPARPDVRWNRVEEP